MRESHTDWRPSGCSPSPVGNGLASERDELIVGDGPGLGVELDEDAPAARRLD
jgi:L-alanine-DL-glutamate epimerase-like enolase superfamily enzyme